MPHRVYGSGCRAFARRGGSLRLYVYASGFSGLAPNCLPLRINFDATLVRVWIDARFCAYYASGSRESRAMLHEGRACRLHLGLIGSLRLSVPPRWGSTPFPHFRREYAAPTFRCRIITPPSLRQSCAAPYCLAISLSILPFAAPSIGQLITTPHIHFQLACPL